MPELDFESDAFLVLLSDALHAGPGSPSWQRAVQALREDRGVSTDELSLLIRAREHLESGKPYRSVKAGAGFTRQLMTALDAPHDNTPKSPAVTRLISIACGFIVSLAVVSIAVLVWRGAAHPAEQTSSSALLADTVSSLDFDSNLPDDWQTIGQIPLSLNQHALRLAGGTSEAGSGGGIACKRALAAGEPFSLSTIFRTQKLDDHVLAELFIADSEKFDPQNGVTPHELVWLLKGRQASVIDPAGQTQAQTTLPADFHGSLPVRLTVTGPRVSIEQGDRVVWAGAHELDATKPRYVGLRFLRGNPGGGEELSFARVRINMKQAN